MYKTRPEGWSNYFTKDVQGRLQPDGAKNAAPPTSEKVGEAELWFIFLSTKKSKKKNKKKRDSMLKLVSKTGISHHRVMKNIRCTSRRCISIFVLPSDLSLKSSLRD